MKPILIAGTVIVNLALIAYTVGIVNAQRRRLVSAGVLAFLTAGVAFDVTATIFMIIGSTGSAFSLHGILGYSSLTGMVIDTALAWRHRLTAGNRAVSSWFHRYSRLAYIWWILAYVTGALLVFVFRG
ncbi:MAG TPA: hypothetical protein VMY05_05510 [Acidobacteriota bacterium]|nr:hypothetical protein [Acidobacteriota bacterium]